MNGKIHIQIDRKKLLFGFGLAIAGVIAPALIHADNFKIYEFLYSSIEDGDNGRLIIAAFKLVILNSLRALPHYLGAFIIAESIEVSAEERKLEWIKGLVAILIIPIVYKMIYWIYKINYDLGIPALIVIFSIIYLEKANFSTISMLKKSCIIILLLLGVQWMDIIPFLSRFGFGRGEISQDIKLIATFINGTEALTLAAIIFFFIFTVNAFLINKILSDEHKLILAAERHKKVERELNEARMQALEARTSQEIQSLVHDLKTPLTSIQALASIAELMEQDEKIKTYLGKIVNSVDILNKMISEILYEDKMSNLTTGELFDSVFSQISSPKYADKIVYHNACEGAMILANKIRLSRAVINIIDNAYNAIENMSGKIYIKVEQQGDTIALIIEDNGMGMDEEVFDKIWDIGFSTRDSTGLGLSFIQRIIRQHHGDIEIFSTRNQGTTVKILLPEGWENEGAYQNISN